MAKPPPLRATSAGEPPLDRALGAAAAGDAEGALRWAVPLVKEDLGAAGPLYVLGRALAALGESRQAVSAFEVAADRGADLGNLPLAIAALAELAQAGADVTGRTLAMAKLYAKGSLRIKAGATMPPARAPEVSPLPKTLAGAPLLAQASEILDYARAALDSDREKQKVAPVVPPQGFFSSFSESALRALIGAFEVKVYEKGGRVIDQGAVGAEAFVLARGELEVHREQPDGDSVLLARLGNAAVFGEMALLSRAPRAASVVAARPSIVLMVRAAALDDLAKTSPQVGSAFAAFCHRRMVANLVRTSPLLGPLSASERQALIERFSARTFEVGDNLIVQGEESDGLHVIASGQVRVVRRDNGEEVAIAGLGVGEVVGEVSLVFRRVSNAAVVAEHPTLTLHLPRARFMEIVREHPTLLAQLYELAVKRDEETSSIAAEEASEADDLII